jgi:hypothetical protein
MKKPGRRREPSVERYLLACERGKLRQARRIYHGLDVATQREADRLLAEQNHYHLEQAQLAQDSADFYGRLVGLLDEHGVETPSELPLEIRDQLEREAEALDRREEAESRG